MSSKHNDLYITHVIKQISGRKNIMNILSRSDVNLRKCEVLPARFIVHNKKAHYVMPHPVIGYGETYLLERTDSNSPVNTLIDGILRMSDHNNAVIDVFFDKEQIRHSAMPAGLASNMNVDSPGFLSALKNDVHQFMFKLTEAKHITVDEYINKIELLMNGQKIHFHERSNSFSAVQSVNFSDNPKFCPINERYNPFYTLVERHLKLDKNEEIVIDDILEELDNLAKNGDYFKISTYYNHFLCLVNANDLNKLVSTEDYAQRVEKYIAEKKDNQQITKAIEFLNFLENNGIDVSHRMTIDEANLLKLAFPG